jgi:hypothetical protein
VEDTTAASLKTKKKIEQMSALLLENETGQSLVTSAIVIGTIELPVPCKYVYLEKVFCQEFRSSWEKFRFNLEKESTKKKKWMYET